MTHETGDSRAEDPRPVLYSETMAPPAGGTLRGPLDSFRRAARERSLYAAVYGAYCYVASRRALGPLFRTADSFSLGDQRVRYLPISLATERRVEVPLALEFLRAARSHETILEVGNSLAPYLPPPRVVVDKFEKAPGVMNVDLLSFHPEHPFDRVVSVSTLEHIGYDEPDRDPGKFDRAVDHLLRVCLGPGGRLLATFPIGYNPAVDGFIERGHDGVGELRCLERVSASNDWREVSVASALGDPPRRPYPGSTRIAVWQVEARSR